MKLNIWVRRCKARLEPHKAGAEPYHGRCDLPAGHAGPHFLERGHDEVRWSTEVWK